MKGIVSCGLAVLVLQALAVKAATAVTNMAAGFQHSLLVKSHGSLWEMGENGSGELGDGFTNLNSSLPEQILLRPQPVLTARMLSGTNLQFQATGQCGGDISFADEHEHRAAFEPVVCCLDQLDHRSGPQ